MSAIERLPQRVRAGLLLAAGVGVGAWEGTRTHLTRLDAALCALGGVAFVLGVGGLVRPGVIGRDHELAPGDRPIQIGLVVAGLALGGLASWWRWTHG